VDKVTNNRARSSPVKRLTEEKAGVGLEERTPEGKSAAGSYVTPAGAATAPSVSWTQEELRQAVENFANFLKILWEWELREETEAVSQLDVSLGRLGGKDGEEVK